MLISYEAGIHNENILMVLIRNIKLMCVHIFCFLSGYNHGKKIYACAAIYSHTYLLH